MPECTTRADGGVRRVGVEIELQGLSVAELGDLVASTLDGKASSISIAESIVEVPELGEFRAEIDLKILRRMARQYRSTELVESMTVEGLLVDLLSDFSSLVIPCEIVTPPIPMTQLASPMDRIVEAARAAGAKGTRRSPLYAFGVHLNIEPPDLEAPTVLAYLRAFVCLIDWIIWRGDVDILRRMTPYIDRYPEAYDLLVTDNRYMPAIDRLIDDYLAYNPTRNRALDMLPLFAELDELRVLAAVDDPLVKARPALHYRLADSDVDQPGWSVETPWEHWLQVEWLAADPDRLEECCDAFQQDRQRVLYRLDRQWREDVQRWLRA